MTSEDGQTFLLRVKRPTGTDLLLGFPHSEISNIIENAAMQAAHGKNTKGQAIATAFKTTSFQLAAFPAQPDEGRRRRESREWAGRGLEV